MSGDHQDWNNEPAKQFNSKLDYQAKVKQRKVGTLIWTLLAIGVGSAIILHLLGAY
jgi:hypothetical protein